jgi:hypothetical protein
MKVHKKIAALLICFAVGVPAAAASQSSRSIEFARSSWGQTVMSWKILSDGSGWRQWTEQTASRTGHYVIYTQRLESSAARYGEIEQLLRPTQAFARKTCRPMFTDAGGYQLRWVQEKPRVLYLYAACSDAWAKGIYDRIGMANEKMKLWTAKSPVEQTPSDYRRVPLEPNPPVKP